MVKKCVCVCQVEYYVREWRANMQALLLSPRTHFIPFIRKFIVEQLCLGVLLSCLVLRCPLAHYSIIHSFGWKRPLGARRRFSVFRVFKRLRSTPDHYRWYQRCTACKTPRGLPQRVVALHPRSITDHRR